MPGLVSLVGAGPGDPGLITAKGLDRLRRADVVVYDRLVPSSLLSEAPPGARLVDAGKAPGDVEMGQDQINSLLVDEGSAGRRVVRLKGGDPFVFGRGGEEAAALAAAGVRFEVVPGVTSAVAAPAYAGIPVTHRGAATSVTIVTGHEDPNKGGEQTDWDALARHGGTLCILMGASRAGALATRLMSGGREPNEAVAAVSWGTTGRQRVARMTLSELRDAVIEAPAVIVIGPVAALSDDLRWFDPGPLAGRTIVVTRAREQASVLRTRLEDLGATVIEVPTIRFVPPTDPLALRRAVEALAEGAYEWAVFTSPRGVEQTLGELWEAGFDARSLALTKVAAIGPGTADRLAAAGLRADLVPTEFVAESLADAFPEGAGRVGIFRAEEAREVLPDRLRDKRWEVEVVAAYRTVLGQGGTTPDRFDAVTFTSSSTVKNFVTLVGDIARPAVIACIGPVTAETAREMGWEPTVVAQEHTIDGLVAALVDAFSRQDRDASPSARS